LNQLETLIFFGVLDVTWARLYRLSEWATIKDSYGQLVPPKEVPSFVILDTHVDQKLKLLVPRTPYFGNVMLACMLFMDEHGM
jgi:hypothetical protein